MLRTGIGSNDGHHADVGPPSKQGTLLGMPLAKVPLRGALFRHHLGDTPCCMTGAAWAGQCCQAMAQAPSRPPWHTAVMQHAQRLHK